MSGRHRVSRQRRERGRNRAPRPSQTYGNPPRRERRWPALVSSGIAGAVVAVGIVALTGNLGGNPDEGLGYGDSAATSGSHGSISAALAATVDASLAVIYASGDSLSTGGAAPGGSAIAVSSDGTFITASRLVGNATAVRLELASGTVTTATVLGSDPATGIAVLHAHLAAGTQTQAAPVDTSSPLTTGEDVTMVNLSAHSLAGQGDMTNQGARAPVEASTLSHVAAMQTNTEAPDGQPLLDSSQLVSNVDQRGMPESLGARASLGSAVVTKNGIVGVVVCTTGSSSGSGHPIVAASPTITSTAEGSPTSSPTGPPSSPPSSPAVSSPAAPGPTASSLSASSAPNSYAGSSWYSIPIGLAIGEAQEITSTGHITRGWLGVAAQQASTPPGVLVVSVESGSPAADAGLSPGDVIISIENVPVATLLDLEAGVFLRTPGTPVVLTVLRGNRTVPLMAVLGSSVGTSQGVPVSSAP